MKKTLSLLLILILLCFFLTGCGKKADNESKKITVNVYNKESELIYNEVIESTDSTLFDIMEKIEKLKIKYEDSDYGKFITSIKGIEQGDKYYWNYYINMEYATAGVSSCLVEDNAIYDFRIEKFE